MNLYIYISIMYLYLYYYKSLNSWNGFFESLIQLKYPISPKWYKFWSGVNRPF